MTEQLHMPWGAEGPGGIRPPRAGTPRPSHPSAPRRRPRPAAGRPVRGEPDLPERAPAVAGEWRIDPRTRLTGLRGISRARAALRASGPDDGRPGREHAA